MPPPNSGKTGKRPTKGVFCAPSDSAEDEPLRRGGFEVEIELRIAVWFTIKFDLHRVDPGSSGTREEQAEIDVGSGLADG